MSQRIIKQADWTLPTDQSFPLPSEAHSASLPNPQDVDWGWGPPVEVTVAEPAAVTRHELCFGLRRPDGSLVPEGAWAAFAEENLPTCFPAGYTVLNAAGGWRSPAGFVHEPSKVVVAFLPAGQPGVALTVAALALCWRITAQQLCVLWTSDAPATAVNL